MNICDIGSKIKSPNGVLHLEKYASVHVINKTTPTTIIHLFKRN